MKIRKIVSLVALLAFIVMACTGIVMFLAPQSRVAYWTGWELFGLSKRDYDDIHSTFMVLFAVSLVWHTVLNWKSLVDYLRASNRRLRIFTREFSVALVLCLVFFFGTVFRVVPFDQFLDIAGVAKRYWASTEGTPPWAPADATSLAQFCDGMENLARSGDEVEITIDCDAAVSALRQAGIELEGVSQRLDEIARTNDTTPQALAEVVMTVAIPVPEPAEEAQPDR